MKIFLGADHRGYAMKAKIATWLFEISDYADRIPDTDEVHIPFITKVIY